MATLPITDTFDGSISAAKWTVNTHDVGASISAVGGVAVISLPSINDGYSNLRTVNSYDLTAKSTFIKLVQPLPQNINPV
jgi:hypothetical protein